MISRGAVNDVRQLILHIGCHKTGTTAIQRNLYQQRHALARLGWQLFTPTNLLGQQHPNGHANKYVQVSGEGGTLQAQLTARFFADLGRCRGNVIVSAEELSWLFDEARIGQYQQRLAALFDEITVVSTCAAKISSLCRTISKVFALLILMQLVILGGS